MATTLGNRVTTTTQDFILPQVVDTILNSNVFATRMLSRAKKWRGEKMQFPVIVLSGVAGGSFSGFDTFSTTASDTRRNLSYSPAFYEINAALPLDEMSVNVNQERVLDLITIELAQRAQQMADEIGTLFYSDGTGNSSKDFLGLEAIVDDSTNVTTIGGLSRSTFTTLKSTVTASGGTLTLAKMATLYNDITSGFQRPTVGLCTEAVFSFYEELLQPQERIMKDTSMMKTGLSVGTGTLELFYKGFPVIPDEKATSQTLYFLNEDFLDWYGLPLAKTTPIKFKSTDIKGNDYSNLTGLGFSWSDWIKPTNSASVIGHIYLGGELISNNFKRHGKLTGITGV